MMKRGQVAIEFLTTYGWAVILILVMIGAIAYFGFFKPTNFVSDSCSTGSDLGCSDFVVYNERATLKLINNVGKTINITNVTYINTERGQILGSCTPNTIIQNGKIADLNCNFVNPIPNDDNKKKIKVEIIYNNAGSAIPHIIEGSIITDPKPALVLIPQTTCDAGHCCTYSSRTSCPSGVNSFTYCGFTSTPTDDGCANCCSQNCEPCYNETELRCHDSNNDGFADSCISGGNMIETCTDIYSCSKISCTALGGCCALYTCSSGKALGLDSYGLNEKGNDYCVEIEGLEKCFNVCGICESERKCADDYTGICCQFSDQTTCEKYGPGDHAEGSNLLTINDCDVFTPNGKAFCLPNKNKCAVC
ncbi:MAG: hypothetical protein QXG00_03235 [Candidatus Woesearchaeota archaeon]